MKGLRKYLTPFAPDQSGAASVLYDLGGILVICDAGGCAGNICGFDEPRWTSSRSAVFSAGLRDMDAILGRDDRLVEKLASAARRIDAGFAAIIGTPVPAVIGTDFRALGRMAEKKTGLPVFTVDCYGMKLYDDGASRAYVSMLRRLTEETSGTEAGRLGVFGACPLEMSSPAEGEKLRQLLSDEGWKQIDLYGFGADLSAVKTVGRAERNLVTAPSGLAAARYLQQRFGTPYEVRYPMELPVSPETAAGKRVLIVHQQVFGNSLRKLLLEAGAAEADVASWFMMDPEFTEAGDRALAEEDDFIELAEQGGYDLIFADETMRPMIPAFRGQFVETPHFAVSGKQVIV